MRSKRRRTLWRLAGFGAVALIAVLAFAAWWMRMPDLRRYEAAIKEIESSPGRRSEFERKHDCVIEAGPPLRVAFRQPGGIMDNWTAIVYDPTGMVRKARQFKADWSNWNDPALQDAKHLFGGDLRWAEPLGGNWYRCTFT